MRVRPCGDTAVLLDCESLAEAQRWYAALDGVAEVVLGARTVLVRGAPATLRSLIAATTPATDLSPPSGRPIVIPVTYDGADLDAVAAHTGLSPKAVVAAHTGTPWTVAFGGFAPGFAYLTGGDPRLAVPRRDSPRKRVRAGAVGLAAGFSAVYPRESPGGWQLIGHTATPMWDLDREPPALLASGDLVRFKVAP